MSGFVEGRRFLASIFAKQNSATKNSSRNLLRNSPARSAILHGEAILSDCPSNHSSGATHRPRSGNNSATKNSSRNTYKKIACSAKIDSPGAKYCLQSGYNSPRLRTNSALISFALFSSRSYPHITHTARRAVPAGIKISAKRR